MTEKTTSERASQNSIDILENTLKCIKKEIRKKNPRFDKELLYQRYLHLMWEGQYLHINWSSEMFRIISYIENSKFKNNKEPKIKLISPSHSTSKVKP